MIAEVVFRAVADDSLDIVDIGEMVDARLSDVMDIRIVRLTEKFEPTVPGVPGSPHRGGRKGRPPIERAEAAEWLVAYLLGRKVKPADVFADGVKQGFSMKTVRRAAHDLCVVKEPVSGPTCEWSLREDMEELVRRASRRPTTRRKRS